MKKLRSQILPGILFSLFCLVATSAPSGCPLPCGSGGCTMSAMVDNAGMVHCPHDEWETNCCNYVLDPGN